jgi:hypothetical protein
MFCVLVGAAFMAGSARPIFPTTAVDSNIETIPNACDTRLVSITSPSLSNRVGFAAPQRLVMGREQTFFSMISCRFTVR